MSAAPDFTIVLPSGADTPAKSLQRPSSKVYGGSMRSDGSVTPPLPAAGLDAHNDARALVRLVQCSQCSYPLRSPVTLPCGQSVCRECLPRSHLRENISYPATEDRQLGITCPFAECAQQHSLEDCSISVVLLKIMESIRAIVSQPPSKLHSKEVMMEEIIVAAAPVLGGVDGPGEALPEKGHTMSAPGGRLVATHLFAESGLLHYTSDVAYLDDDEDSTPLDNEILLALKEAAHKDLDCHVCYNLMLDPTTTPCGHTFCRKCLARILDHSNLCPVCRKELFLPASLARHASNKYLIDLLASLCPEQVAARLEAAEQEERHMPDGLDTALFVCTMGFPTMPTYLHIFEPRYRLMIRRAIENNGQFGMVTYNERGLPQGNLGRTQFMEFGTMLQVVRYQVLPDGRSFIECKGVSRFRVLQHGVLDGYMVGRVQKLEDISLSEEEALEASETSVTSPPPTDIGAQIDRLPTAQLLRICVDFVERNREQSAPWLRGRILEAYGEPPTDAASFPYWFASVLPLHDDEKYRLLPATSIRERLKITVRWVHRIEAQRWYHGNNCTLL